MLQFFMISMIKLGKVTLKDNITLLLIKRLFTVINNAQSVKRVTSKKICVTNNYFSVTSEFQLIVSND